MRVLLFGGFLGAGKTSAMNRLLTPLSSLGSVAFLINEFGEIPVDTAIVDRGEYALREITGGCACCTLKGKLLEAVAEIRDDLQPDYLLVEATGLAEPREILDSVATLEGYRAAGILCVDPAQYLKFSGALSIFDRQVVGAEIILLTKGDLRSDEERTTARSRIAVAAPHAHIFEDPYEALNAVEFRETPGRSVPLPSEEDDRIIQRTLRFSGGFQRKELETRCAAAQGRYGEDLLRLKGVVLLDQVYTAVHYTDQGLESEVLPLQESHQGEASFLVIIGRNESLLRYPPEEFFF